MGRPIGGRSCLAIRALVDCACDRYEGDDDGI